MKIKIYRSEWYPVYELAQAPHPSLGHLLPIGCGEGIACRQDQLSLDYGATGAGAPGSGAIEHRTFNIDKSREGVEHRISSLEWAARTEWRALPVESVV
jgi:hypothetical protein